MQECTYVIKSPFLPALTACEGSLFQRETNKGCVEMKLGKANLLITLHQAFKKKKNL